MFFFILEQIQLFFIYEKFFNYNEPQNQTFWTWKPNTIEITSSHQIDYGQHAQFHFQHFLWSFFLFNFPDQIPDMSDPTYSTSNVIKLLIFKWKCKQKKIVIAQMFCGQTNTSLNINKLYILGTKDEFYLKVRNSFSSFLQLQEWTTDFTL